MRRWGIETPRFPRVVATHAYDPQHELGHFIQTIDERKKKDRATSKDIVVKVVGKFE
jgi:hypothetical protein